MLKVCPVSASGVALMNETSCQGNSLKVVPKCTVVVLALKLYGLRTYSLQATECSMQLGTHTTGLCYALCPVHRKPFPPNAQ